MNTHGNVVVKILYGKELILPNQDIIDITITESIFSFCMYGSITFYDRIGWSEILQIQGSTIPPICIMWKQNDEEFVKKIFVVWESAPVKTESQLENALTVRKWIFVEPIYHALTYKKFSKSWGEGTKASTIFDNIFRNFLNYKNTSTSFQYYETPNETLDNFYMPSCELCESLLWLMRRCSGEQSKRAGYLCFINSLGSNFITISNLFEKEYQKNEREIKSKTRVPYTFGYGTDDLTSITDPEIIEPKKVKEYDVGGKNIYTVNHDGKKIENEKITYSDQIKNVEVKGATTSSFAYNNYRPPVSLTGESDMDLAKNIEENHWILNYFPSLMASLSVKGSATRYAGMVIDIRWKSASSSLKVDSRLDGFWMVKTIFHQFRPTDAPVYKQNLICMKPGYNKTENGIELTLPKGTPSTNTTTVLESKK